MHDKMSAFDDAFHASKVLTAARLLLDLGECVLELKQAEWKLILLEDTKIVSLKNVLPPAASAPYNNSLLLRALRYVITCFASNDESMVGKSDLV